MIRNKIKEIVINTHYFQIIPQNNRGKGYKVSKCPIAHVYAG